MLTCSYRMRRTLRRRHRTRALQELFCNRHSEINKLALNIVKGREWAGIHYPSDSIAGLLLGEA